VERDGGGQLIRRLMLPCMDYTVGREDIEAINCECIQVGLISPHSLTRQIRGPRRRKEGDCVDGPRDPGTKGLEESLVGVAVGGAEIETGPVRE
jgi:hypothetical protein